MNIIFLSPVPNFKGGAERCLFDMMGNPLITPILVTPENGELTQEAAHREISHHTIPYTIPFGNIGTIHRPFSFLVGLKAIKSVIIAARQLKKIAVEGRCDMVHSNGLKAHIVNCASRLMGGPKAVVHIHDIPYTTSEKMVWKIMQILCDEMVIVSKPCWPCTTRPSNVQVVHNGTEVFESSAAKRSPAQGEPINFGFCGRIHPAKGLHLLIQWIAHVRKAGIDARLSVRGSFSEDAPGYETEIRDLVHEHELANVVEFYGYVNGPEKLYDNLDMVVVPSQTPDPLPRSVMEAMARGMIVMGYPAGGIPEMIDDGETGFLVRDADEFHQAIIDVFSQSNRFEEIGQNAKRKIECEFSMAHLYEQLNIIYYKCQA